MSETKRKMPVYRCHKLVHALHIASVDGLVITPSEIGFAPFSVEHSFLAKHEPVAGGYFVVYAGGYTSYSPAEAFEQGYAPVENNTSNVILQIAKACHSVNKAYCESLGDLSQPEWRDAPVWQRESAMKGVVFHRANPNAGPAASHESWLAEKKAAGWVYGAVKNPDATPPTHPCFTEYENLPKEQQAKDALFIAVVRSFD